MDGAKGGNGASKRPLRREKRTWAAQSELTLLVGRMLHPRRVSRLWNWQRRSDIVTSALEPRAERQRKRTELLDYTETGADLERLQEIADERKARGKRLKETCVVRRLAQAAIAAANGSAGRGITALEE